MAKACVINPRVRSGEVSPLFISLKKYLGSRDKALYWYTRAKSPDFKNVFSNVRYDENDEPLFEDLLNKCGLKEVQEESVTLSRLNSEIKQEAPRTYAGVRDLQSRAVSFNNSNPFRSDYFATIEEQGDKVVTVVKPMREMSNNEINRMAVNVGINKRLEKLLSSWGIGIGVLTDLEERLGMNGVTDFDVALNSANGIKQIIRIAKGDKGQQALPEEFAHFATEAMGSTPLRDRILARLSNREVLQRILGSEYEDYERLYNSNLELMASEALGKLVAKALNDENVYTPNEALFQRYLTSLKNFFSKHDGDEIDSIIDDVMSEVYQLTNNIVNNRYKLETSNVRFRTKMANLNSRVDRDSNLLKKVIEQELKRLKIYGTKEEFNVAQTAFIEDLQNRLEEHQALEGIFDYIQNSLEILHSLSGRLNRIEKGDLSQVEKFKALRNIRNYIASYGSIMEEIRNQMNDAHREGDDRFKNKLKALLDENLDLIASLGRDFYSIAKDEFADFIRPFVGEGLTITLGKYKGKVYTAEELIESVDRDITIFDRWLDSMADSSDPILQIYDQQVKKQKHEARLDTLKFEKEIERRTRMLEQAGVNNTDFMYERDEEGNLTGYFIQKTWWSKYSRARGRFFENLKKKYGENPTGIDLERKNQEIQAWYKENTVNDSSGVRVPSSKYDNPAFARLNKAQKDYHSFIMESKKEFDAVLPTKQNVNLAPQIRKDFLDRVKSSKNPLKPFWESMKDSLVKREDEEAMGGTDELYNSTIMNFEGNEVMRLPIYYTRKLEDMRDLSTDVTSSMIAYAAMANDFNRMNEVIDALEIGRLLLAEREVTQRSGGKKRVEKINVLGREIHNILTKQGDVNYFMQKLNTFMEMQVYGRMQKDEGDTEGIDYAKAVNLLNKLTSYSTTALSLLTGSANALQNLAMSNIEAISGRFFNVAELAYADKEYGKALPAFLGEFGNRIKTSKLALFSELFNVPQDYKQHVRNVDFNKKTWASRLFNENTLFFTTQAGDHWTQHRIAIALAKRMPMMYKGQKTNLWEVLEVVPIDKNNPKLGATLEVKKGATKVKGSEFGRKDIILLSNKIRAVENMLYGIYNSEDKNALQQIALGRLVLLYRNWMRPLWLARFGRGKYNFDLGDYVEGYYQTMWRFLTQSYKDIRQSEFDIIKQWNTLTDVEKANIKRGIAEVATYWTLFAMISMISGMGDDDKNTPWALRLAAYSALRLITDMGALLPSPTMLDEGKKLFTSPIASLTTLNKLRRTIDLVNPVVIFSDDSPYDTTVRSGMYKGFEEWEKILIDLLPFRRQVVNAFDPSEPARWYK